MSVSIQLQAVKGRCMVFLEVGWFFSFSVREFSRSLKSSGDSMLLKPAIKIAAFNFMSLLLFKNASCLLFGGESLFQS